MRGDGYAQQRRALSACSEGSEIWASSPQAPSKTRHVDWRTKVPKVRDANQGLVLNKVYGYLDSSGAALLWWEGARRGGGKAGEWYEHKYAIIELVVGR